MGELALYIISWIVDSYTFSLGMYTFQLTTAVFVLILMFEIKHYISFFNTLSGNLTMHPLPSNYSYNKSLKNGAHSRCKTLKKIVLWLHA